MAGAANCAKIRLTARKHGLVKRMHRNFKQSVLMEESAKSWCRNYLFNDKKWISLSKGVKFTYAYHLMFLETKLI
jgi:hypothetical protein